MNSELLEILVCPESKQNLKIAPMETVSSLNEKIKGGSLKNRAGEKVSEKMDEGLIRDDNKWLYPVRNGIPIMLIEEAIPLA